MDLSSPRLKALTVTAGISLWFFIISSAIGVFSLWIFVMFSASLFAVTQLFSEKLARGLELFAIVNTKIFLGILFVFALSIYGIYFRVLRIDLMQIRKTDSSTYWIDTSKPKPRQALRQF